MVRPRTVTRGLATPPSRVARPPASTTAFHLSGMPSVGAVEGVTSALTARR